MAYYQQKQPSQQQSATDFIPGTASIVEDVDKRLMVMLRDGRKLVGTLRTFDQFANVVLEDCYERIFLDDNVTFGEKRIGLYLIRGENVVLLGDMDVEKDAQVTNSKLKRIPFEEAKKLYKKEQDTKEEQARIKRKALSERGIFDPFTLPDTLYFE
eukprot:TRINITY_DN3003_c0_g1_i1.p1 TRINITY_DN3003_c0_g1~~TRINITY_DN3003_c0_g1_i1.p1  ORF type:complete len:156 (-),score=34.25 TRINITY_DN3003_c0_g1_i1:12-479(-)